jgi:tetratricopeptide (TPR) repeat protein
MGALVLAAAALATVAGADRARAPFDPAAIAERGLLASLDGDRAAAADALRTLRGRLTRTPTDAVTRTVYASLLAETAADEGDRRAAAAEGRRAVVSAPHEEAVRRAVVKVMARTGDRDQAVATVRALFAEAPGDAALVLAEIEPFLTPEEIASAVPEIPQAWRARAERLRATGHPEEADDMLLRLLECWPGDLAARRSAAEVAVRRGNEAEVARLVPAGLPIPEDRDHALLLVLRARGRAFTGDPEGARRDAGVAARLAPQSPTVAASAGDALERVDPVTARSYWMRALFLLERTDAARRSRIGILLRLARLDEREGREADALRRWREVLELEPAHVEARRRVVAIGGDASLPRTPPR